MKELVNECKDGWSDGWVHGWMNKCIDGSVDGWVHGWMVGLVDGWMGAKKQGNAYTRTPIYVYMMATN